MMEIQGSFMMYKKNRQKQIKNLKMAKKKQLGFLPNFISPKSIS